MHDETEKAIMEWDGSHYNNHYMIIFIFFEDNNYDNGSGDGDNNKCNSNK